MSQQTSAVTNSCPLQGELALKVAYRVGERRGGRPGGVCRFCHGSITACLQGRRCRLALMQPSEESHLPMTAIPVPGHLDSPPQQPVTKRIRRTFRSRKSLSGTSQWIIDYGLPFLAILVITWSFAARVTTSKGKKEGFAGVYKAFTLMDPPEHFWLWAASILGWLIVPAIIGGVAGHVITARIESAKQMSSSFLYRRRTIGQRLRPPTPITPLSRYINKSVADQHFVDVFVRIAHRNYWDMAQDHWEMMVSDTMSTVDFAELDRHESLRRAEDQNRMTASLAAVFGLCAVCEAQR